MLTFEMKSNWVVRNKSKFAKVEKEIESLETKLEQLFAYRKCVKNNFRKEAELFTGTPDEYNTFCSKHEADIRKCKLRRLDHLAIKLLHHERFIFSLPHTR